MRLELSWVWLFLPLLVAWVWYFWWKSYAQLRGWSRRASLVLRLVVLVALLGAISRPVWVRSTDSQRVVFLLDVSRSVSGDNIEAAMGDIDRLARQAMGDGHEVSVIAFGRGARQIAGADGRWDGWTEETRDLVMHEAAVKTLAAERAKSIADGADVEAVEGIKKRIEAIDGFRAEVVGDYTDAAVALRLAENTGGVGQARTVYLFTDGNFNRGVLARPDDVELKLVMMDKPIPPEVAATSLTLPTSARVNQGLSADLRIVSTVETQARIAVYRDGYAMAEFVEELKVGENSLRIPGISFREKGFHTVEVAVRAASDTRVENNRVRTLVMVPGELRVLYVDSDEAQQSYLSSALGIEGVQVQTRPASGVPQTLEDLLGFDAFILSNVAADKLTARQMQLIRAYVQDFGGGFIMLGGDQSFGLGGYYGTPVEEVLPVTMPIQKDLNRPSLAIELVIDKSGSMSGTKIQLAKRAAMATAEVINPRDQIGIVGFDSAAREILELTSAGDRAAVDSAIEQLDAEGGTFLYPALEIAQERLRESPARKKHIIILSDGQTEGYGYPEIAMMMASEGITCSTVGIGDGADKNLLESIAASGGGRFYFTNDFYAMPQIFTREALRAANSMLVERLVLASVSEFDECLREINEDDLPPLSGYVATTARPTAKVVLVSDTGDPILARWRCGLGQTAAFTSDTKPRWGEEWIRWPDFAKFWAQLVRGIAGKDIAQETAIQVSAAADGDVVRVMADLRDAAGRFVTDRTPELSIFESGAGAGGATPVKVEQVGAGLFAASVPMGEFGATRQLNWRLEEKPGQTVSAPAGFVQSFSPEFLTLGADAAAISRLASEGTVPVSVGSAELSMDRRRSTREVVLWPWLLGLALLAAPVDILCRRLG